MDRHATHRKWHVGNCYDHATRESADGKHCANHCDLKPRWQGIQTADKWMVANEAGAPCICMACMPDWSGIFMRTRLAIATLIFTGEHNILFFHIAFHFLCSQGAIYVTTCIFFSGLGDKLLVALCAQTAM